MAGIHSIRNGGIAITVSTRQVFVIAALALMFALAAYSGQSGSSGSVNVTTNNNYTTYNNYTNVSSNLTNESVDFYKGNSANLTGKIPYQLLNVTPCNVANEASTYNIATFQWDCVSIADSDPYIPLTSEGSLNVNSAVYWAGLTAPDPSWGAGGGIGETTTNAMNQSSASNDTASRYNDTIHDMKFNNQNTTNEDLRLDKLVASNVTDQKTNDNNLATYPSVPTNDQTYWFYSSFVRRSENYIRLIVYGSTDEGAIPLPLSVQVYNFSSLLYETVISQSGGADSYILKANISNPNYFTGNTIDVRVNEYQQSGLCSPCTNNLVYEIQAFQESNSVIEMPILRYNDTIHDAKFNNQNTTNQVLGNNDSAINGTIVELQKNDSYFNGSVFPNSTNFKNDSLQVAINGKQTSGSYETTSNKTNNTLMGTSDSLYPTQNAVKTYVDNIAANLTSLGLTLYFWNTSSGISNYTIMNSTLPQTDMMKNVTYNNMSDGAMVVGRIDNNLNITKINSGIWSQHTVINLTYLSSGSSLQFMSYIYKNGSGFPDVLISQSGTSAVISQYNIMTYAFWTGNLQSDVYFNNTDMIVMKLYSVVSNGGNASFEVHVEGTMGSAITLPIGTQSISVSANDTIARNSITDLQSQIQGNATYTNSTLAQQAINNTNQGNFLNATFATLSALALKADGVFANATFATLTALTLKADGVFTNFTFGVLGTNDSIINNSILTLGTNDSRINASVSALGNNDSIINNSINKVIINNTNQAGFDNSTFLKQANISICSGTDKLTTSNGWTLTCGTDQTSAGSPAAPATVSYLVDDVDSTLTNETSIPGSTWIDDEFNSFLTTIHPAIGTPVVITTIEPEIFGGWNIPTAASLNAHAGVSIGQSTVTTDAIYNVTKLRRLDMVIKMQNSTKTHLMAGIFNTTVTQNITSIKNGYFFNYTNASGALAWWNGVNCKEGQCTVTNLSTNYVNGSWVNLSIRSPTSTYVQYWINGVIVGNITTNLTASTDRAAWVGPIARTLDTLAKNVEVHKIYFESALW